MRLCRPLLLCLLLAGCALNPRIPAPPANVAAVAWAEREAALQSLDHWSLDGRVAAAFDTQGWQASITWRQAAGLSELHLSGPLGVGAHQVRLSPEGVSIDGGPVRDDLLDPAQTRLGFEVPLRSLRYWLLGVPDPSTAATVLRDAGDRAAQIQQLDWTIALDRYRSVDGDRLPGQIVITRTGTRVRIIVDHWNVAP